MDGTMVDSMPWHARSWVAFAREVGLPPPDAGFFRRTTGLTGVEVMREFFGERPAAELRARVERKEAIYRELFGPAFREVRGFGAFADAARGAGVKVACATAGDADNIAFVLDHLGRRGFFDAVVGAHDVLRGKPHPDLFLLAAQRMGVDPAQCLVFEDAPHGIEAARRAGMRAVAIATTLPPDELGAPDHVVARAIDFTTLNVGDLLAHVAVPAR
ncbi:MAG: HAD family phosphatase [Betaproteobacteria bacterium]|nr:HAD family phosphatase [Betaproteobacteria bacterium]MBK6602268.1 HAD family phosphatase [Betaproteobacteria bacterium]MBK7079955.1 HAD family phosphatase [Betaproteobacteria bacterium]MBK7592960.1 HAD family phosphatase [Betaproteobacteria bacterium]MBK7743372.1 HAD family phosphatase [Betaproteobacteria bacterium]